MYEDVRFYLFLRNSRSSSFVRLARRCTNTRTQEPRDRPEPFNPLDQHAIHYSSQRTPFNPLDQAAQPPKPSENNWSGYPGYPTSDGNIADSPSAGRHVPRADRLATSAQQFQSVPPPILTEGASSAFTIFLSKRSDASSYGSSAL